MCGRFGQTSAQTAIAEIFELESLPPFKPNFNVSPTQQVAAVKLNPESQKREGALLRWGLIPSWAKDTKIGNQCINAKCETIAVKPAFRSALKKRRCLIIADGFYEWQGVNGRKQPMWITRRE